MPSSLTDNQLLSEVIKRSPPNQIPFFKEDSNHRVDFNSGPILIVDHSENNYKLRADEFIRASMPDNTIRAYLGDLHYFISWYSAAISHQEVLKLQKSGAPLSINEDVILQFIFHNLEEMPTEIENTLIEKGVKKIRGTHSLATVKRRLVSLTIWHKMHNFPDPCDTQKVKDLLSAMAKSKAMQKKSKALTKNILENLVKTCSGNSLIEIRDKALLLFGWCSGGRRRSEIAEATYENLEEMSDGDFIYHIGKSKTDRAGKGFDVPVKGLAAAALREWIRTSGIQGGYLFRSVSKGKTLGEKITSVDINRIVKKRVAMAGYDPTQYSAHSLRRGFVTEAGRSGCPLGDVMAMTGHKSVHIAMKYYESGAISNNGAANIFNTCEV